MTPSKPDHSVSRPRSLRHTVSIPHAARSPIYDSTPIISGRKQPVAIGDAVFVLDTGKPLCLDTAVVQQRTPREHGGSSRALGRAGRGKGRGRREVPDDQPARRALSQARRTSRRHDDRGSARRAPRSPPPPYAPRVGRRSSRAARADPRAALLGRSPRLRAMCRRRRTGSQAVRRRASQKPAPTRTCRVAAAGLLRERERASAWGATGPGRARRSTRSTL
jgi:hypothetical protein